MCADHVTVTGVSHGNIPRPTSSTDGLEQQEVPPHQLITALPHTKLKPISIKYSYFVHISSSVHIT